MRLTVEDECIKDILGCMSRDLHRIVVMSLTYLPNIIFNQKRGKDFLKEPGLGECALRAKLNN